MLLGWNGALWFSSRSFSISLSFSRRAHACTVTLGRAKGGQDVPKSKTSRVGPSETIFRDPPTAVSEEVSWGRFWALLRDLVREIAWGGASKTYRGGQKLFSVGGLLVRFCPPPPLFLPPPLAFSGCGAWTVRKKQVCNIQQDGRGGKHSGSGPHSKDLLPP